MNSELKSSQYYADLLRPKQPELQKRFAVDALGIFGSYVRGEQDTDSDLDILIRFAKVPSLVQWIQLEDYLSQLTGVKVDLVIEEGLKPAIGQRIRREVIWL